MAISATARTLVPLLMSLHVCRVLPGKNQFAPPATQSLRSAYMYTKSFFPKSEGGCSQSFILPSAVKGTTLVAVIQLPCSLRAKSKAKLRVHTTTPSWSEVPCTHLSLKLFAPKKTQKIYNCHTMLYISRYIHTHARNSLCRLVLSFVRVKVQFIVPPLHPRSLADTFYYLAGVLTTDTCMRRQFNNNTHGKMEICHFDIATMDNVGCSYIAFAKTTDCSGLSLTEVPEDIPISTLTLLLDDNAFTVLESGMFSNLPLLQALSLVRFSPPFSPTPSPLLPPPLPPVALFGS